MANVYCPRCQAIITTKTDACPSCHKKVGWFTRLLGQRVQCPNMADCPMYGALATDGALKVFIAGYCTDDFQRCLRKQKGDRGESVPRELMPNGQLLRPKAVDESHA